MKLKKKRPKEHKYLDGNPIPLIAWLIRSQSDAERICEWLLENADNCKVFPQGIFRGLRDAVAKWNCDELIQPMRATLSVSQAVEVALKKLDSMNIVVEPKGLQGILTMLKAFTEASSKQMMVNAARCSKVVAPVTEVGSPTIASDLSVLGSTDLHDDEMLAPVVGWKYEDERADDPYADQSQKEMEALVEAAWKRLPPEVKLKLSDLGISVTLVGMPNDLKIVDAPIKAPDEDGGITINIDFWLELFDNDEDVVLELEKEFKAIYSNSVPSGKKRKPKVKSTK